MTAINMLRIQTNVQIQWTFIKVLMIFFRICGKNSHQSHMEPQFSMEEYGTEKA